MPILDMSEDEFFLLKEAVSNKLGRQVQAHEDVFETLMEALTK